MLKKRIIPCLDIKNGRTVKGINFVGLRDAGDPVQLAKQYAAQGADELVFLDISATVERRKTLIPLVSAIAREINIPFTIGGGINSVEDVHSLLEAGADKVSVNSAAVKRPSLLNEIAQEFGRQCLVLAIDAKLEAEEWMVYTHGGRQKTNRTVGNWAREGELRGAGEILLTSMNNDGVQGGFALGLTSLVASRINLPIIASGGAGSMEDFTTLFKKTSATGGLAASIFHFGKVDLPSLKQYLKKEKIAIR